MVAVSYRCPYKDMMVQAFIADPMDSPANAETFETVHCTACSGVHLVSSTGRVLSMGGPVEKRNPPKRSLLRFMSSG
jgi:hypothetical protein